MKTQKKQSEKASLQLITFNLLKDRPASKRLADVAKEAGLGEAWVKLFHLKGNRMASSCDKVQKLYEYLTGKPLI